MLVFISVDSQGCKAIFSTRLSLSQGARGGGVISTMLLISHIENRCHLEPTKDFPCFAALMVLIIIGVASNAIWTRVKVENLFDGPCDWPMRAWHRAPQPSMWHNPIPHQGARTPIRSVDILMALAIYPTCHTPISLSGRRNMFSTVQCCTCPLKILLYCVPIF